ncbi:PilZ domain-containing protein [Parvularcula sp. LCG005]|uniref:PilZ domain-containing protein n=1 Tax=Parvularcula sp. LCG005 TaxID=3078805 RepID=UPI00294296D0|nr:PilZ domain-containing protein [Parvularcula sp. LCG005]WOI52512.1 PilZ domain-containing protein [Parvularcula sp. LCG005]
MGTVKSYRTDLPARLLIQGMPERSGRVVRMARGGVLVEGVHDAADNASVVLYLETGERFEGTLRQVGRDVVSIAVRRSEKKHSNLWRYLDEKYGGSSPIRPVSERQERRQRGAERIKADVPRTLCTLPDGRQIPARVMDISLSGMAIAMDHVAEIDDIIAIGKVKARIIRRTDKGYGCEILPEISRGRIATTEAQLARTRTGTDQCD